MLNSPARLVKAIRAITDTAAACFSSLCLFFSQRNLRQERPAPPIHMPTAVSLCLGRAHCQLANTVFKHTSEMALLCVQPGWIPLLTHCLQGYIMGEMDEICRAVPWKEPAHCGLAK